MIATAYDRVMQRLTSSSTQRPQVIQAGVNALSLSSQVHAKAESSDPHQRGRNRNDSDYRLQSRREPLENPGPRLVASSLNSTIGCTIISCMLCTTHFTML